MKNWGIILFLAIPIIVTGCSQSYVIPNTQTPTSVQNTSTPTIVPSSTPTYTPRPSPSQTPTASLTPTASPTPAPVAISANTANRLTQETTYQLPERGRLISAGWMPDGMQVTVVTNKGISLLDARTLEEVLTFPGFSPLAYLDNGDWIVRSKEQLGRLNPRTRELKPIEIDLPQYGDWWPNIAISQNGDILVYAGGGNEIKIVSLGDGKVQSMTFEHPRFEVGWVSPSAISPDGKWLVVETDTFDQVAFVVNLETLKIEYELYRIYNPHFSPDSQYLLLVDNGGIQVLKARNGIQLNRFSGGFLIRPTGKDYIYYEAKQYAALPDSQRVGVVYNVENQKSELYIWSMQTGRPETIIKGLPTGIQTLAFSPAGDRFLTVSEQGILSIWSLENRAVVGESQPYDRGKIVVSPEGKLLAVPRGSQVEVYAVESGELRAKLGNFSEVKGLAVDSLSNDRVLISGFTYDYKAFSELWDLSTNQIIRRFTPYEMAYSYSDNALCTTDAYARRVACGLGVLQIFDVETGKLVFSRRSEGQQVWAISPDGNTLATCTVLYNPETWESIPGDRIFLLDISGAKVANAGTLEAARGGICSSLAFSADSRFLAAQSGFIWALDDRKSFTSFTSDPSMTLAFNQAGDLLIAGKRVIQTSTGQTLTELAIPGSVYSAAFTADGYRLVLRTDEGVEIWSVK